MSSEDPVDRNKFETPGVRKARKRENSNVELRGPDERVQVIVTQAFGPKGDSLVGISDVRFDGHPAITIGARGAGKDGLVHLSPIHGDQRKQGLSLPEGTRCELYCPVSKAPLTRLPDGSDGTEYCAIYLTPECSEGAVVAISNVWGHHHSRVIDHFELLSVYG